MVSVMRQPQPQEGETFVRVKEYAALHGVHPTTVLKWIKKELITATRVGRAYEINNDAPRPSTTTAPRPPA